MKNAWKSLGVVCVVVTGMYAYTAPLGRLESLISNPEDADYNLLVQGFRASQLSLKKEVPTGFTRLADPYDPVANRLYRGGRPYGMGDLSYYKGRLYIYFGVTPALMLFWPFVALTGHYLSNRLAIMIFCATGFLASVGLLRAVWRRYFADVRVGVVAACALALGLATGVPALLPLSDTHQVATSCGYMLTMLALGAIWCAVHESRKRSGWLAMASVTYGLAVGARPSLLFGAAILLVPVAQAWRERRRIWALLLAATIPITLIGLGLMLYNTLRFENPFEFGQHYQLGEVRSVTTQYFRPRFLWFNFRMYFLEPLRWNAHFPFVHKAAAPPLPSGYYAPQSPRSFGFLTNIPLVWLALAVPLAWRERSTQERDALRWFVTAVCVLFGMSALTIGFFHTSALTYAVDFLPALVFLAVVGILGFERALAPHRAGLRADQPVRRHLVRWGWIVLLGFSVVFNVSASIQNYLHTSCSVGLLLAQDGRVPEAIHVFENALRIEPGYAEGHQDLGVILWHAGKRQEAIREFEYALRLEPDYVDAHVCLGAALVELHRPEDAIRHCEEALRIKPDSAEAHVTLGNALSIQGKEQDAMAQFQEALRINPGSDEVYYSLGNALMHQGKVQDAIEHYEEALRINPDNAEVHNNLGFALFRLGKLPEAIEHFREALRINPDYAEARNNLAVALAQTGKDGVPSGQGTATGPRGTR